MISIRNGIKLMRAGKTPKWKKEWSVGNAIIDAEHINLINLANDVMHAIRIRDCENLKHTFELFDGWVRVHLKNEEKIAHAISFDFVEHKLAQQYGLNELRFLTDELLRSKSYWLDDAVQHSVNFFRNWMIDEHIINLGRQMRPALQKYHYQFWPCWDADKARQITMLRRQFAAK